MLKKRRRFFSNLKWLLLVEFLVLIYIFVHNVVGMRRRQLTLLMEKEKALREEITLLRMEKARLLSFPSLEAYARKEGLVPVDPLKVEALIKEGDTWRWRKNVENPR